MSFFQKTSPLKGGRTGLGTLLRRRFGLLEGVQGQLPRVLQCGGNMALRRINVAALARTSGGVIAQPLPMLRVGWGDALGLRLPRGQRLCIDSQRHGCEGLKTGIAHPRIDGSGCHLWPPGGPLRLPQGGTEGARPALRLPHHCVAPGPTRDQPRPQGCARPWEAAGVVPVRLGVLVFAPRLHLALRLPTARGRRAVRAADAPRLLGPPGDGGAPLAGLASQRVGAARGKRPGRGRMLEHGAHSRPPGRRPDQVAAAPPAG